MTEKHSRGHVTVGKLQPKIIKALNLELPGEVISVKLKAKSEGNHLFVSSL